MTCHTPKYDQQTKIRNAFYFIVCFLALTTQISLASAGIRADFNGDGFEDLVVGVPGQDIDGVTDAGAIQIFYGNATGTIPVNQKWHLNSAGIQLSASAGDRFGSAVTQGDFNGDGYADLAVGIPFKDNKQGQVLVLYGSSTGLTATGNQIWNQDNLADIREAGDQFGSALTSGDFNGDGYLDLAIGVPKEDFPDIGPPATEIPKCGICIDAGIVNVIYGTPAGLNADRNELWHQDRGISDDGWVEYQDCFGASLESGDFNGNGADDLAVGAICEHTGGAGEGGLNNGAVSVYYGTPGVGLTGTGAQYLRQWNDKVVGYPQANDAFGFALAVGDFNNDNYDDLAIGVPGEEVDCNSATDAGAVAVFYGKSGAGITVGASRNELWCRNTEGIQGSWTGRWGYSVATGDFDADGFDDVAIGAPTDKHDGVIGAGSVTILYGSSSRLTSIGNQFFSQNSSGMPDDAEPYDWFGHTLTTADFNGDGNSDLAIGVPFENVSSVINAGAVHLLLGEVGNGLSTIDTQFVHQDSTDVIDQNETDDQFGGRLVPQLRQSPWPNQPPEGPGINLRPVLSPICAHSVVESQTLIFTVNARDPNGPPLLILSATDLPAGAVFTDFGGGSGEFRWTPATDVAAGSPYNVTFTATDDDGAGLSDSETTLIFVTPAGDSSNHLTATLSADNASKVYVNGVVVCASSNWKAAKVFTVPLQHGANVVAIRGTDAGGVAGLLADLAWDGSTAVTDTSWKVSSTLVPDWETVGFDDSSWSFATSYGVYGVAPWLTRVVGFPTSSTAQWIWTADNTNDDSAYLRYNITVGDPPPATLNMKMSADNASEVYVNGALVGTTSDWQTAATLNTPLQEGINVVAIKGIDAGGVAGLLADLAWDGSTAVTDTSWKVSSTLVPDWETVGFDDSSWSFATSYGVYGVAPWLTRVVGFPTSSTAQWIWTGDNFNDNTIYLRYTIVVP